MSNTSAVLKAIKDALSHARISTYESAVGWAGLGDPRAAALYAWNAQVSSALLAPLHICEVVVRNAVSDALEAVYGPRWPWNNTFVLSLPNPPRSSGAYNARLDIQSVASRQPSTGKVIPELKFVFWQEMFTRRHDVRLWNLHLRRVFPNQDATKSIVEIRRNIYSDLEQIRRLRNRIAHHEPIFSRNLSGELDRMMELVELRDKLVGSWMRANQNADDLLGESPRFKGGALWTPSHVEIAETAYSLWIRNGKRDGTDQSDWFAARRLLGLPDS